PVNAGGSAGAPHGRCSAGEHRCGPARESTRGACLRQQPRAIAPAEAKERCRPAKLDGRRLQCVAQLARRARDVTTIRSRNDDCNKMRKGRIAELLASAVLLGEASCDTAPPRACN